MTEAIDRKFLALVVDYLNNHKEDIKLHLPTIDHFELLENNIVAVCTEADHEKRLPIFPFRFRNSITISFGDKGRFSIPKRTTKKPG